jgi:hypothetical protein
MKTIYGLAIGLFTISAMPSPAPAAEPYAVYESESEFEIVMEGAKAAIQEKGMYINNVMHIGEMLARTGKDLGLGGEIYGRAESIEFCSAVLSRKMAEEVPSRIVNCPFILAVYTLSDQEGKTFVAHRAIPEQEVADSEVMAEVAEMLKEVAEGATSW